MHPKPACSVPNAVHDWFTTKSHPRGRGGGGDQKKNESHIRKKNRDMAPAHVHAARAVLPPSHPPKRRKNSLRPSQLRGESKVTTSPPSCLFSPAGVR
ncbi:hypothetical protein JMJ77_0006591 [Colletotrichum scovillei]|uniref:Uncharacterized protein n=1 Tax=Colletotrichum scovillei TaxID=1209932 RepID=A0A9P7RJI4_9PEZI|nr:hypothetical protein JMJ77_0006591 [Colletotrichum scovillei]KAG7077770.1 hypothetical protein JMJ76_0015013 [Colletotrichum scovillei]KAG7084864.1 hypothetical protein JMJ78_0010295 [Colletotrichum scovillei]